jgi:hypothetical protein
MSKISEEMFSYSRSYLGIARPMVADVHVLGIQYDIPINGKDWHSMSVEQRVEHYKKEFNSRLEATLAEIERHTKWYSKKLEETKDE